MDKIFYVEFQRVPFEIPHKISYLPIHTHTQHHHHHTHNTCTHRSSRRCLALSSLVDTMGPGRYRASRKGSPGFPDCNNNGFCHMIPASIQRQCNNSHFSNMGILYCINSLATGRCGWSIKLVIFKLVSKTDIFSIPCEITLRLMPQDISDD